MARAVLIISVALLVVSAPPLMLMGRELAIGAAVADRYAVERVVSAAKGMEGGALRAAIGGHVVELVDDRPFLADEPFKVNDRREQGLVSIAVDGVVVPVGFRPGRSGRRCGRRHDVAPSAGCPVSV